MKAEPANKEETEGVMSHVLCLCNYINDASLHPYPINLFLFFPFFFFFSLFLYGCLTVILLGTWRDGQTSFYRSSLF